jgi:transposase
VFLDESGFMLTPVVRRTWAQRGQTPVLRCWDRRDRLSVIAAITTPPRRRRRSLYFSIQEGNVTTPDVVKVVGQLMRGRRGVWLVWDRRSVHRAAEGRLKDRFGSRIRFERLPAYAPELNPVEQVWNRSKHDDLANLLPQHKEELCESLSDALDGLARSRTHPAAFIRMAGRRNQHVPLSMKMEIVCSQAMGRLLTCSVLCWSSRSRPRGGRHSMSRKPRP